MEKDDDVFRTTTIENRHNEFGHEILNPIPMQPPIGFKPEPSMFDVIRQQIRQAQLAGDTILDENEDEADDFDIEDDPVDYQSRWENDTIPSMKDLKARHARLLAEEANLNAQNPGRDSAPRSSTPEPTLDH